MDFVEKSFSSAGETSKLLITLSTGVIAFCVTLVNVKDAEGTFFTPTTTAQRWTLVVSWILLLLSTGVGVWTQLAITHVLSVGSESNPVSAWSRKITVPFQIQIVAFLAGIVALTSYGAARLFG